MLRSRLFRLKVLTVIFSCLVLLIAGEILTRIYETFEHIDFRTMRKELLNANRLPQDMWMTGSFPQLRPNARVTAKTSEFQVGYAINSKGLRDREYAYQRTAGNYRIVALGDSFTFGEGVPYGQRFADIAEDYFTNLELITLAVPGYGIEHELVYLAHEGVKYSPDCVILFINRPDTLRRLAGLFDGRRISIPKEIAYENYRTRDSPGTVYLKRGNWNAPSMFTRLLDYSHAANFVAGRVDFYRLVAKDRRIWLGKAPFKDDDIPVKEPDEKVRERAVRVIEKFMEITDQNKCRFLVISIDPHYDLSYLKAAFPKLEYFDLSQALSARAHQTPLRFVYDRHFNPRTHQFLGQKVIEILQKTIPGLQAENVGQSVRGRL
jgi:hypothetical protein